MRQKTLFVARLRVPASRSRRELVQGINADVWPAPGSEDTELGVFMGPEVGHGETEVYAGVQA